MSAKQDWRSAKEEQMVLRVPPRLAPLVAQRIKEGAKDMDYKIEKDGRRAAFYIGNETYKATVVDLPCVVETLKTVDRRTFFKSGDIGQMLLVHEHGETPPVPPLLDSGLTPPTKCIRSKRFDHIKRKRTLDARITAEEEVNLLLSSTTNVEVVTLEDVERWEETARLVTEERRVGHGNGEEEEEEGDGGLEELDDVDFYGPCNLLLKIREPTKRDLGRAWCVERSGAVYVAPSRRPVAAKCPVAASVPAAVPTGPGEDAYDDEEEGEDETSSDEDEDSDEEAEAQVPQLYSAAETYYGGEADAEAPGADMLATVDAMFDDGYFDPPAAAAAAPQTSHVATAGIIFDDSAGGEEDASPSLFDAPADVAPNVAPDGAPLVAPSAAVVPAQPSQELLAARKELAELRVALADKKAAVDSAPNPIIRMRLSTGLQKAQEAVRAKEQEVQQLEGT